MTGISAIEAMFEQADAAQRAAFLPYYIVGYPTYAESLDAIAGMAAAGVDDSIMSCTAAAFDSAATTSALGSIRSTNRRHCPSDWG